MFKVVLSFGKGPIVSTGQEERKELPDYLPEDQENDASSEKVGYLVRL